MQIPVLIRRLPVFVCVYAGQKLRGQQETRGSERYPEAPGAGENTVTASRGPQKRDCPAVWERGPRLPPWSDPAALTCSFTPHQKQTWTKASVHIPVVYVTDIKSY